MSAKICRVTRQMTGLHRNCSNIFFQYNLRGYLSWVLQQFPVHHWSLQLFSASYMFLRSPNMLPSLHHFYAASLSPCVFPSPQLIAYSECVFFSQRPTYDSNIHLNSTSFSLCKPTFHS